MPLPKTIIKPTQCPFCGHTFDCTIYPQITIPGDNKLKKLLLKKSLFFVKCPSCNEEFKLKANCIYCNVTKKEIFIATDFPNADFESLLTSGDIQFNNVSSDDDFINFIKGLCKRRIVHNVDAFREKVLLSENNYDDRIIELMKLSLSGLIEKNNHMPVYRIFLDEASGSQMLFVAILGAHAPFEYISIKTASNVYTQFKDKYLGKLGRPEEDEYISTDQEWAKSSGLLKDDDAGFMIPFS